MNQISCGNGDAVEPVLLMLRRLAETCRTYGEARAEILAAAPDLPFALTVSSAQEGQSGVFEPGRQAVEERPASAGRSWADNNTWGAAGGRETGHGFTVWPGADRGGSPRQRLSQRAAAGAPRGVAHGFATRFPRAAGGGPRRGHSSLALRGLVM